MTRVLVTGGRDFDDYWRVEETLDSLAEVTGLAPITWVITGDARGVDAHAASWAAHRAKLIAIFEADWASHGKAAGPMRNARMLTEGKPDIVVAFPGGKGTADMVRRAEKAGVRIMKVSV